MAENIIELNDNNFKETIQKEKIVVVDFWAAWCGPCQMFSSIFEDFAKNNKDIVCAKVNVDQAPKISEEYKVLSIPTIMFFKNGNLIKQQIGVLPSDIIKKIIDEFK